MAVSETILALNGPVRTVLGCMGAPQRNSNFAGTHFQVSQTLQAKDSSLEANPDDTGISVRRYVKVKFKQVARRYENEIDSWVDLGIADAPEMLGDVPVFFGAKIVKRLVLRQTFAAWF
jgi:hypothetical protein